MGEAPSHHPISRWDCPIEKPSSVIGASRHLRNPPYLCLSGEMMYCWIYHIKILLGSFGWLFLWWTASMCSLKANLYHPCRSNCQRHDTAMVSTSVLDPSQIHQRHSTEHKPFGNLGCNTFRDFCGCRWDSDFFCRKEKKMNLEGWEKKGGVTCQRIDFNGFLWLCVLVAWCPWIWHIHIVT